MDDSINSDESKKPQDFHFEIDNEDMEKHIPVYMIKPNSTFRLIWSLVIFLLVIYTALVMPIRLAFMDDKN